MKHNYLNILVYSIFSLSLIFNQQVISMTSYSPMNMNTGMNNLENNHAQNNQLASVENRQLQKNSSNSSTTKYSNMDSDCAQKKCYEMCQANLVTTVNQLIESNIYPVYTSSVAHFEYTLNYTEIKIDQLYKPPKFYLI